jgi:acyl carrier protein phosphodiesterase
LANEAVLPERLALIAPRMAAQDWLGSYRDFAVLEQVITGMGRRLSRPGVLDGSLHELERLYVPLSEDFRAFYPELLEFVRQAQVDA